VITETEWNRALTRVGVRPLTATAWASAFADEVQPERFSAGMADILDWLPQILHETTGRNAEGGYTPLECMQENLNYSAARLCAVWPSRFATLKDAEPYAYNPRALANKVYGGRMGNTQPMDGWDFAGKCPIMLTGRGAYEHVGNIIGQDLTVLPHLILQPHYGLEAAIGWWEDRIPDSMLSDQVKLRRKVNGGTLGMEHTVKLAGLTREAFA
jgi:putative chitinase